MAGGLAAFNRAPDIFRFVFFAAVLSTALSVAIGVTALAVAAHLTKPVDVRHLRDTILKLTNPIHPLTVGVEA